MDFLRNKITMVPLPTTLPETFFADLLEPRPDITTLTAFESWAVKAQQQITLTQTRKNCPLAWAGIFVDQVGMAIVMHFTHGMQLNSAKSSARTMTQFLEKEMQHRLLINLRPLDEIDRRRIDSWMTPTSLCPSDLKRKREKADAGQPAEDDGQPPAKRSRLQLLADLDTSDDEGEPPQVPMLCIQGANSRSSLEDVIHVPSELLLRDLPRLWQFRVTTEATVVVAEVGVRPTLTFVRCHHEARRLELSVQTARAEYERRRSNGLTL